MPNLEELSKTEKEKLLARVEEARNNPVVFIDRFLYTFNPKQEPYHFEFRLFDFQRDLVKELQAAIENGYDIFVEKCREMGATYTTLAVLLWFWRYIPGSNFLLGSRKEAYVDNTKGDSDEAINKEESLFGKIEYMLQLLPPFMLPAGFDFKRHLTFMSLVNPENGNVISGESANPNFSRGGRFKAILMDEFAFWEHDTASWGATADTTNCRIVLTTPGIKPGKAKRLRFGKDGEKIKIVSLTYNLDPRKTDDWLAKERARRSAEDFAREIMINWETAVAGKVYEEIQYAKVGNYPYEPSWPLYVSWDFGLDGTAFQWWQINPANGRPRLVDCYENHDKPIRWYAPFFGKPIDSQFDYSSEDLQLVSSVDKFKVGVHFGDPDVSKRSLITGTSTRQELEALGIYVQTKPEANDFISRREKTKVLLQNGIEVNQTPRTDYWLECMRNARYPQRQETTQVTTAVKLPIHDWTSHQRTATEYFAVNIDSYRLMEKIGNQNPPPWAANLPSWSRGGGRE